MKNHRTKISNETRRRTGNINTRRIKRTTRPKIKMNRSNQKYENINGSKGKRETVRTVRTLKEEYKKEQREETISRTRIPRRTRYTK